MIADYKFYARFWLRSTWWPKKKIKFYKLINQKMLRSIR